MQKSALLAAIQREIHNHDLTHFMDDPPSIAQGGRGVVITGCSSCRKQFGTVRQFIDHLTHDVLPPLIDKLSTEGKSDTWPPQRGRSTYRGENDSAIVRERGVK